MDKQNVHTHIMGYESDIKKNEVLIHAITWIHPENIMPGECQWTIQKRQTHREKNDYLLIGDEGRKK